MSRAIRLLCFAAVAAALAGCGGSSGRNAAQVSHHDPSQGWTADVPAGWTAVAAGPTFVRGNPLTDPTRLLLQTYRDRTPANSLTELAATAGISTAGRQHERSSGALRWQRYNATEVGKPKLSVDVAVAKDGADTHIAALVTRPAERARLVQTALLPALDSFASGPADEPASVLSDAPTDPAYWPTAGWRTASPASQGMDGKTLDAMLTTIRAAKLPIDSVTVVRHGYVVVDAKFGRFAARTLGEPYASGQRHELQSATKSVTSMVLGIALNDRAAAASSVETPLLRLADAVGFVPKNVDDRKRALTIEDLLTMQSGLAWKESGYAYTPASGNDVMAMLATNDWTRYVIDRPMAAEPGTTFVYDSGNAQLLSAATSVLTGKPAAAFAAKRLFGPLGITKYTWLATPGGVDAGGFGLALHPLDLTKLAYLYLHQGRWDGRQVVPVDWTQQSTTDHVKDPRYEYGYLWWLDRADGYAYMAGLYGQFAAVVPEEDLVAVVTAHIPATVDSSSVTRWLLERYILPAAR